MDVSAPTILRQSGCYRSYSNASLGDLLELGLLALIAENIAPAPPVGGSAILLEAGGYILTETGGRILLET
ncbi:MAG TPA: hypothetical protein VMQ76_06000 [Terracidiphilus sp.]|nr:hypothetical protein [Terracidiphilus sp.]